MKKVFVWCLAVMTVCSLVACGSVSDRTDEKENEEQCRPLEIKEYGYFVENGFLYCAVILSNPNDQCAIEYPTFKVTAYDAEDHVLGTDELTLTRIDPGQEYAYAGFFFDLSKEPERVEITIVKPEYFLMESESTGQALKTTNVTVDNKQVRGEVVNPNQHDIDSVMVTAVFRDDNGKLVSGNSTFLDQIPAGGKAVFAISIPGQTTSHYEVTANEW